MKNAKAKRKLDKGLNRVGEIKAPEAAQSGEFNSISNVLRYLLSNYKFILLVVLAALGIYFNSLKGEFVADDILGFKENVEVRDLKASLKTLNLQKVIYAMSFRFFDLNPVPLHLTHVLFHILAVILVFVLVSMLFDKKTAKLSSLLFAVSPINTEAVSWISASIYITNAMGFLFMAVLYLLFRNTNKIRYFLGTVVVYGITLVLVNNSFSVMFIPLLIIIDQIYNYQFEKKVSSRFRFIPLIFVMLIHIFLIVRPYSARIDYLQGSFEANIEGSAPYFERVPYEIYSNFKLLSFPLGLSIFHEGDVVTDFDVFVFWAFTVVVFGLILYLWEIYREVSGLLLFVVVSLGPTFSPVQTSSYFTERYLYLGNVAFCSLVALFFIWISKKARFDSLAMILGGILVILYSTKVIFRNREWSTPENLWKSAVRVVPNSSRAHKLLGETYLTKKDYEGASDEFKKAIELRGGVYPDAYNNLGLSYLRLGKVNEAEKIFMGNINNYPLMWQSYYNMSEVELVKGRVSWAQSYLLKVLELDPQNKDAKRVLESLSDAKEE
ncbi:hypothetical protein A2716_00770 [candidate division WWE3 bacterium RIFCSPHIGHO2_01_FULL_40_23]|uniref:Uncharacterized protein n=1 Tax=candidate division WWE3 bacterium RIFCSPLOWO2_01_FULL_41_18 TaxID=1802625 RepID=A0A1F4VED6_UNCKA|nr:MAG: hypothetical protein A2716_00770 [candidate division WWE3 bacterium RIFCSPHIGHO2_01_FULL_40_23]OGC55524.1 MAG: hypothetical protein A3A78_01040 [candidate division WWE3 bacterium RIFCSPLOWO2_01_FULL_41_18]